MPRVSVVTALYNHVPFLAERARSLLDQSMADFEWIIIDDRSPDDSYAVMRRLTAHDPRVKLARNPENIGFTATVQRAIDRASGDFIYIADSDDSCDLRFLETMAGVLSTHPQAGFAYCRGLRMDVRNGVWGGIPRQKARYYKAPEAFPRLALDYHIRQPTLLYRRAMIADVGGFAHPAIRANSDWYLALRLALRADVIFHPEPLAYHRTHGSNMSGDPANGVENFILLKDVFDNLPAGLRQYETLREPAYRAAARKMRPALENLCKRGSHDECRDIIARVRQYVPDFDLARGTSRRGWADAAARAIIKFLTYRPINADNKRSMRGQ